MDDIEKKVDEIESLCLNCGNQGITRLYVTRIPFFKDLIITSFECECGFSNNELQPATAYKDKGIIINLKVSNQADLNRQIVKSDYAEISIPEIEFEIKRQNGIITTIEGLIDRAVDGLRQTIQLNPEMSTDFLHKITLTVSNLIELKSLHKPFNFILNDPSGNSFIENPLAPQFDPSMSIKHYKRSPEENKLLGLIEEQEEALSGTNLKDEVIQFPSTCYNCNAPCFTNMKMTEIPHFKEVMIMATVCDVCGFKDSEVKGTQGISEKGIKIEVRIENVEILKKDVIRSDMCSLSIPELELEIGTTGGGKYTTVEGLIEYVKELLSRSNPFIDGDSAIQGSRDKINKIIEKLDHPIGFTIILDDPCGNSFVDGIKGIEYERTYEQNDQLGLNDMKTDL